MTFTRTLLDLRHRARLTQATLAAGLALWVEVGLLPMFSAQTSALAPRLLLMLPAGALGWYAARFALTIEQRALSALSALVSVLAATPVLVLLSALSVGHGDPLAFVASAVLAGVPAGLVLGALAATLVYFAHSWVRAEHTVDAAERVGRIVGSWMFALACVATLGALVQLSAGARMGLALLLHTQLLALGAATLTIWAHAQIQGRERWVERLRVEEQVRDATPAELASTLPRIGVDGTAQASVVEGERLGYRDECHALLLIPRDSAPPRTAR